MSDLASRHIFTLIQTSLQFENIIRSTLLSNTFTDGFIYLKGIISLSDLLYNAKFHLLL